MLVTTHSLIAMTLAVTTKEPAIYLPLAAINHPVLDSIPHFGFSNPKYLQFRKRAYWPMVIIDAVIGTTTFFIILYKTGLSFWLLFTVCLLAGWPDLVTLYQRKVNPNFAPKFRKIHYKLQHERPWLIVFELAIWGVCLSLIFI